MGIGGKTKIGAEKPFFKKLPRMIRLKFNVKSLHENFNLGWFYFFKADKNLNQCRLFFYLKFGGNLN
jgi:hypothetical protein